MTIYKVWTTTDLPPRTSSITTESFSIITTTRRTVSATLSEIETIEPLPSTTMLPTKAQTTNLKITTNRATQPVSQDFSTRTECVPFHVLSDKKLTYEKAREYCRNLDLFMFNPHSDEDVMAMFLIGWVHENL